MKKTDFGFTCAESDEEKAKLILDRMKANGEKVLNLLSTSSL